MTDVAIAWFCRPPRKRPAHLTLAELEGFFLGGQGNRSALGQSVLQRKPAFERGKAIRRAAGYCCGVPRRCARRFFSCCSRRSASIRRLAYLDASSTARGAAGPKYVHSLSSRSASRSTSSKLTSLRFSSTITCFDRLFFVAFTWTTPVGTKSRRNRPCGWVDETNAATG